MVIFSTPAGCFRYPRSWPWGWLWARSTSDANDPSSDAGSASDENAHGDSTEPCWDRREQSFRLFVGVTVTVVWSLNFLAALVPGLHYQPNSAIEGAMLVVAGGVFGAEAMRRRR